MRSPLFLVLLAAIFVSGCTAAQPVSSDREGLARGVSPGDVSGIKNARHAYIAACLTGNWTEATNRWTEDGVRMVSDGPTEQGRPALRSHFDGLEKILRWDETWDDIQVSGNLAYARTHGTLTAKLKSQPEPFSYAAKSLTIFRKQPDGRWLIAVDCYNADPTVAK